MSAIPALAHAPPSEGTAPAALIADRNTPPAPSGFVRLGGAEAFGGEAIDEEVEEAVERAEGISRQSEHIPRCMGHGRSPAVGRAQQSNEDVAEGAGELGADKRDQIEQETIGKRI